MTNTRAAAATISLRAKQELVRLLFGSKLHRKGPHAHRLLDQSIYSYDDLRLAYLKRIHELHPDKTRALRLSRQNDQERLPNSKDDNNNSNDDTASFVELQDAWNRYEDIARMIKKVGKGADGDRRHLKVDADFTLFGVGCSFSDNEQEKVLRSKIMDEASRGWFTAGQLSERTVDHHAPASPTQAPSVSLTSDDMFDEIRNDEGSDNAQTKSKSSSSLISHLIPPHRRR